MPRALTDSVVRNLKPLRGATDWREVSDGGCRGLRLRISPHGEKVWAVRVMVHGRRARQQLGAYPSVSLAEARERADKYRAAAREGLMPETSDEREEAENMTFAQAHGKYRAALAGSLRPNTITNKKSLFERHIEPVIGHRWIGSIKRPDIVEVVDLARRKGLSTGANRVFSEIMACLRWCEDRGMIEGVPTFKNFKSKEEPRNRTLHRGELRAVWLATADMGQRSADFVRLLMLSGQRRDDVRLMRWDEVSLDDGYWYISAERYKTRRDHVVPLSKPMIRILLRLKAQRASAKVVSPYVIRGNDPSKPFNGAQRAMDRLQQESGVTGFTLHDFRRTLRSGLAQLHVDDRTAEMTIGHAVPKIARTYDVYERINERRQALDAWASYIGFCVGPINRRRVADRVPSRTNVMRLAAAG
ncbi:hypothetical protein CKO28_18120 [Rhodovibrio sodomensis]|uniref:Tyr recombinase domain-containing protein n=1 Tax=Rhodovibrio sodomensis TaxID=1088 RepID=A0ABS1DHN3_9PROT|nr:site-specific integrase [Rhodovibrio sodomensis]MBK1669954.1 hypothetical protein [Rhodovibrio sodomensis]